MSASESAESRSLEQTPTWAVALVCCVFVVISVFLEHSIYLVGKWLQKQRKKALNGALYKIKEELMLIGFISLLLPIGQKPITMICISHRLADTMLPCRRKSAAANHHISPTGHHRKIFWGGLAGTPLEAPLRRILNSGGEESDYCANKGRVSLVSQEGLHQLHIFIFVVALFHVLYSVLTMCLGTAKMRKWQAWEKNAQEYQTCHDPEFRLTHETSFGRRHMSSWAERPIMNCIECFFRQFMGSVHKVDYLTLRHGFINEHSLHPDFNFHKYLQRSLDEDFRVVVGVSPPLWAFAVVFLVLNVNGWLTFFWLSFVPLMIILIVGTKLELVITEMALKIWKEHSVVKGTPVVKPNNNLFWFNRPKWVLLLIHFSLFQNAFEIAFFVWTWCMFGLGSCFHETAVIITRLIMGSCAQVLCSYITLPLYALVSEMGSHMNIKGVFHDEHADAVKRWVEKSRKNSESYEKAALKLENSFSLRMSRKSESEGDLQQLSNKFSCHSSQEIEMGETSPLPLPASSSTSSSHSSPPSLPALTRNISMADPNRKEEMNPSTSSVPEREDVYVDTK